MLRVLVALALSSQALATNPEGQKWLEEKSKEPGVISLPSGLMYKVLSGAQHMSQ